MTTDITSVWCGFTIKPKRDMPASEGPGFVVSEHGTNPMPGATWFRSIEDATRGISALVLARKLAPREDIGCDSDVFWHLMNLGRVGSR